MQQATQPLERLLAALKEKIDGLRHQQVRRSEDSGVLLPQALRIDVLWIRAAIGVPDL
jgi:hypothetical protein